LLRENQGQVHQLFDSDAFPSPVPAGYSYILDSMASSFHH